MVVDTSIIIAVITNEMYKKRLIEITRNTELIAPHQYTGKLVMHFQQCFDAIELLRY